MMAAAQPFISGAICKTDQHAEPSHRGRDREAYIRGLEAGPQGGRHLPRRLQEAQPLSSRGQDHKQEGRRSRRRAPRRRKTNCRAAARAPQRLPDERLSVTHKFKVGGHEGYLTVGLYKDGTPGELFITMAKEGSTVSGLMDSFACAVSIALAARRSAQAAVRQVRAHPLRAQRLDP